MNEDYENTLIAIGTQNGYLKVYSYYSYYFSWKVMDEINEFKAGNAIQNIVYGGNRIIAFVTKEYVYVTSIDGV